MTAQRPLGRAAALVALAVLPATGCVTVHGEDAAVPGVTRAQAAKVVKQYTARSNRANRKVDLQLTARIETGVLGEIDEANLKVRRVDKPGGDPGYQPLVLSDTRYLIPEVRGWPKWFVADTANNRDGNRWLLAFHRNSTAEEWKASYLSVVEPDDMPEVVVGKDGYAEPVPLGERSLAVAPGKLGATYTRYLKDGTPGVFADGPFTSGLRKQRAGQKRTPKYVTQYADQAVPEASYPPFALRTADGGALVLFTTRHSWKVTAATGIPLPPPGKYSKTLMSGTPKRSLTRTGIAEQAAVVAADRDGTTTIINRIMGVIAARGE